MNIVFDKAVLVNDVRMNSLVGQAAGAISDGIWWVEKITTWQSRH